MKSQRPIKICIAASAGGHLSQLLKLSKSWQKYDVFYVSTVNSVTQKLRELGRFYITGECNREHPIRSLLVLRNCIRIILKEKPDVIISTGAAPPCLLCLVGKLAHAKIVWIDSIANVEHLSLSGRIIRPFADLILAQWSELAVRYNNVEHIGAVI
jgi:UDP-N-acetylglucosamine:LPS N-acetylglucosamine transferase